MAASSAPTWRYRCLIRTLSPIILAYTLWRAVKDGGVRYFLQRLGLYTGATPRPDPMQPTIWVHAASVGEVFTVLPLIETLETQVLVTTTTPTGAAIVQQQNLNHVSHCYLPVDFPGACKRFMSHHNIIQGWIVETEIWPWLYASLFATNTPLSIINARLSDKTSKHANGYLATTFRKALKGVRVLARSEDDARRFIALGAESSTVSVVGNLKYANPDFSKHAAQLKPAFDLPYVVAASTHNNEELQLACTWCESSAQDKANHILVIVPRHPERADAIRDQLHSMNIKAAFRSKHDEVTDDTQVYIADTLGELHGWYAGASACFIGGSLVERGGHNMLEAARAGCPLAIGPHTFNFKDIVTTLIAKDAVHLAHDAQNVTQFFIDAINKPAAFSAMAERALDQANKSVEVLRDYRKLLLPEDTNDWQTDSIR